MFSLSKIMFLISDEVQIYSFLGLLFNILIYLALINLVNPLIKKYNFKNVLKGYTLLVMILNYVFLGIISFFILESENNQKIIFIVIINLISAILLIISTVYYFSKNYNLNSFFYFLGCFSILISDNFAALVKYYINDFSLNFMSRFLHLLGYFSVYLFITNVLLKKEMITNETVRL